jgi:outer membrane biosynthesis protein TonB
MTVRRILPFLLAALLGAGAALLAACGAGTEAGIPQANASDLKSQIEDVRQAVDDGRCSDVPGQLRQVDEGIDDLPPSTDDQLVSNLRDGADKLLSVSREECSDAKTETTTTEEPATETATTEAPPTETQTETSPAQTTTTPATTTAPTETTPEPPPPPEPEPPAQPQPPPPPTGTPGGGTEPEIP